MQLEYFFLVMSLMIAHVILTVVMSEVAGRLYGDKLKWQSFFFMVPFISLPIFIVIHILYLKKRRNMVLETKLSTKAPLSLRERMKKLSVTPFTDDDEVMAGTEKIEIEIPEGTLHYALGDVSVTPFTSDSFLLTDDIYNYDENKTLDESKVELEILSEWRDKKIDELMEYDQWDQAYERAYVKFKDAEEAGDQISTKVYRAYLALTRPKVRR